jgi:predicted HicB family RNase H-like nuclease
MEETIRFRVSKEDKRLLINEAKKHRLTISAYVRTTLLYNKKTT